MTFGPEYHKINGCFKRDSANRNVIMPGEFSQPEFEFLLDVPWTWTEKVDGTNIRMHWDGRTVAIGGRTDNAQVPTFLIAALEQYRDLAKWAEVFPDYPPPDREVLPADVPDVTLYGEGYGAKIQKGGGNYIPDGQDFILFDVRVGRWWLKDEDVQAIAAAFDMQTVPAYEGTPTLRQAIAAVRDGDLVSRWPNARPEGLVGRPAVDLYARSGQRIITKIKVADFEALRKQVAA